MSKTRTPRINSRNQVWCFSCERYLPGDAFAWKASPSMDRPRFNSYCRPCQRELDRLRWCGERRERNNAERLRRQKREQAAERREKAEFVAGAILLLRRRGLTKSEIAKIVDVSLASVMDWERKRRRVTDAVTRRFGIVLRETAYLPAGAGPVYRRRLPHPDLGRLIERCRPQVRSYPVRNSWVYRSEDAA